MTSRLPALSTATVSLERDSFLRDLLRELAGTLQDVVGMTEASGYISVVGQRIGDDLKGRYLEALGVEGIPPDRISDVLVDLKRRIQGDFYVIEEDEEKIVLGNRACPFGDQVVGRPALCMMTSNVFGTIAAESAGAAKVVLEETIATGSTGCRVVVYLQPTAESDAARGREYFRA